MSSRDSWIKGGSWWDLQQREIKEAQADRPHNDGGAEMETVRRSLPPSRVSRRSHARKSDSLVSISSRNQTNSDMRDKEDEAADHLAEDGNRKLNVGEHQRKTLNMLNAAWVKLRRYFASQALDAGVSLEDMSFTVEELIFAVDCLALYATRQQITELFRAIDEDECGVITIAEVETYMRSKGMKVPTERNQKSSRRETDKAKKLFAEIFDHVLELMVCWDLDGSNSISLNDVGRGIRFLKLKGIDADKIVQEAASECNLIDSVLYVKDFVRHFSWHAVEPHPVLLSKYENIKLNRAVVMSKLRVWRSKQKPDTVDSDLRTICSKLRSRWGTISSIFNAIQASEKRGKLSIDLERNISSKHKERGKNSRSDPSTMPYNNTPTTRFISFEEWKSAIESCGLQLTTGQLEKAFNLVDKNANGKITLHDLEQAMRATGSLSQASIKSDPGLLKKGSKTRAISESAKLRNIFSQIWDNPVEAFCFFAIGGNQTVTLNEVKHGIGRLSAFDINVHQLLQEIDHVCIHGQIDLKSFVRYFAFKERSTTSAKEEMILYEKIKMQHMQEILEKVERWKRLRRLPSITFESFRMMTSSLTKNWDALKEKLLEESGLSEFEKFEETSFDKEILLKCVTQLLPLYLNDSVEEMQVRDFLDLIDSKKSQKLSGEELRKLIFHPLFVAPYSALHDKSRRWSAHDESPKFASEKQPHEDEAGIEVQEADPSLDALFARAEKLVRGFDDWDHMATPGIPDDEANVGHNTVEDDPVFEKQLWPTGQKGKKALDAAVGHTEMDASSFAKESFVRQYASKEMFEMYCGISESGISATLNGLQRNTMSMKEFLLLLKSQALMPKIFSKDDAVSVFRLVKDRDVARGSTKSNDLTFEKFKLCMEELAKLRSYKLQSFEVREKPEIVSSKAHLALPDADVLEKLCNDDEKQTVPPETSPGIKSQRSTKSIVEPGMYSPISPSEKKIMTTFEEKFCKRKMFEDACQSEMAASRRKSGDPVMDHGAFMAFMEQQEIVPKVVSRSEANTIFRAVMRGKAVHEAHEMNFEDFRESIRRIGAWRGYRMEEFGIHLEHMERSNRNSGSGKKDDVAAHTASSLCKVQLFGSPSSQRDRNLKGVAQNEVAGRASRQSEMGSISEGGEVVEDLREELLIAREAAARLGSQNEALIKFSDDREQVIANQSQEILWLKNRCGELEEALRRGGGTVAAVESSSLAEALRMKNREVENIREEISSLQEELEALRERRAGDVLEIMQERDEAIEEAAALRKINQELRRQLSDLHNSLHRQRTPTEGGEKLLLPEVLSPDDLVRCVSLASLASSCFYDRRIPAGSYSFFSQDLESIHTQLFDRPPPDAASSMLLVGLDVEAAVGQVVQMVPGFQSRGIGVISRIFTDDCGVQVHWQSGEISEESTGRDDIFSLCLWN
ncbi:hypothetical protein GUITHDRAFT_101737 [Guillardia theta CCMP2712]|uniref:EF-hand domain-containing protein n=3 Tax=Guillardia theta TaxID=55529 RepID=L1JWI8_GUITC|nr:hypothetical protein GUITHDRAFT_101737 [Guillardia theta CCMP2712]EKX52570.1 hypothetical protein GUITHDRAFT_101737 [Guillardia theta CCMP2712]|eukprot:XP_005839550.1 hypothetical protein GUITHDRAFT_101737 [Guillardia theta CCMP2712]